MTANPLKSAARSEITFDKDPLNNPLVAWEWANHARTRGLTKQADEWARHAARLER